MSKLKYDAKCEDLARHFAGDPTLMPKLTEAEIQELAQEIQDAIEFFFGAREALAADGEEPCHGPQDTTCPSCGLGS